MSNSLRHKELRRVRAREKLKENRIKRNGRGYHFSRGLDLQVRRARRGWLERLMEKIKGMFARQRVRGSAWRAP